MIWSGRYGHVSVETREEILRQTAELRRKQDARLAAHQQRSAVLAGGFLTIGALVAALLASPAVEASSAQVRTVGAIALVIAVANGLCWVAVHSAPRAADALAILMAHGGGNAAIGAWTGRV